MNRPRRRLLSQPCVILLKSIAMKDHSEVEEIDCYDQSTNTYVRIPNQKAQSMLLSQINTGAITSGLSTLEQTGAYFDDEERSLILADDLDNIQFAENKDFDKHRERQLATTTNATRKMLAIRVKALDRETTSSEADISDNWFGTAVDKVNLKSQYQACSYGSLKVEPANTGPDSVKGVYTVSIDINVEGAEIGKVEQAVVKKLGEDLGNLNDIYDNVMICVPPGTVEGVIAYAYVNNWLSVYNNEWCNYVSAQMHGKFLILRTQPFLIP